MKQTTAKRVVPRHKKFSPEHQAFLDDIAKILASELLRQEAKRGKAI